MVTYKVEKDGKTYEYETGRNFTIAEQIKGDYVGYKLGHTTDGYVSSIYFKNNGYFEDKEKKHIGSLMYNPDTDIVTYYKRVQQAKHEFHKSESFGINNEILSNLCPKDRIVIIECVGTKKNVYSISVRKAISVASYMTFKNYEKQAFIQKSEFKSKETAEKKKRAKSAKRKVHK